MASNMPDPVYFKVRCHYNGMFLRLSCSYAYGESVLFTDVDFAAMNLHECGSWLEIYVGVPCEKLYYCIPNRPLSQDIRLIENDLDYGKFLEDANQAFTESETKEISLFMDHTGSGLEEWFDEEMNFVVNSEEEGSVIQSKNEETEAVSKETNEEEEVPGFQDLEDMIGDHEIPKMNKTADDEFLSKMCPEDEDYEDKENEEEGVVHPRFNEKIHWKTQKPILGMRFENPKQLKNMLCNYAVANRYQLAFKKNDNKRLLVKCCKGECTFRL